MSENQASESETPRHIWVRCLYMLLMGLAYQVVASLVFVTTVIQFVVCLVSDTPNARLISFGRSLGRYLQQIVNYLIFASEEIPFPFSDWPSSDQTK